MVAKQRDPLDVYKPAARAKASVIAWEDPPSVSRSEKTRDLDELFATLGERVSIWARVLEVASPEAAGRCATRIRAFVRRRKITADVCARGSTVYVRMLA